MEDYSKEKNYIRVHKKFAIFSIFLALLLIAGFFGWLLGRSDQPDKADSSNDLQTFESAPVEDSAVADTIHYTLPDGWKQATCEGSEVVYILPAGTTLNCDANPAAPVKISIDPSGTNDCNQLQSVSDVKKHVCKSLYINGLRSLKASTEYLPSAPQEGVTINAFYIDTGKKVVKAEYIFRGDEQYQASFEELASSITVQK